MESDADCLPKENVLEPSFGFVQGQQVIMSVRCVMLDILGNNFWTRNLLSHLLSWEVVAAHPSMSCACR